MVDEPDSRDRTENLRPEVDRARRLFLFLRDLAELRSKAVRDIDSYEQVLWFSEVPSGPRVWSSFDSDAPEEVDAWLSIQRVSLPPRPRHPDLVEPWIRVSALGSFDLDEPGLVDDDEPEAEIPHQVVTAYQGYVEQQWRPWAEQCRELKPAYVFYTQLFAMSERQQSLGEIYELVVAIGCLSWTRNGQLIRRHLITAPAEINVDPDTGLIEVRPSETEGRNRFELDMLDPADRGPAQVIQDLSQEVENLDPLALGSEAGRILTRWLNQANAHGHFDFGLDPPQPSDQLKLVLAPALILRRRGQRTLTELLGNIADSIRDNGELTENVLSLVSTENRPHSDGELRFSEAEVYFPLPANDEQGRIVDRIQHQRGVVVQGPPGTGKSHTIANLISHLLAQGKRTLVTSHTERALKVLRDKLPDDIKPLCIALLGSDRQSIQDLEAAIGSISARQAGWAPEQAEDRINDLRSELHRIRGDKAQKSSRLRQIREADTHPITVGHYRGTSEEIARRLASERERFGWIPDHVQEDTPPLTSREFVEYLRLCWDLPDDAEATAQADLPDPQSLPDPGSLAVLFREESRLDQALSEATRDHGEWVAGLADVPGDRLTEAISALEAHTQRLTALQTAGGWASDAVRDITNGRGAAWQALLADLQSHHHDLEEALAVLDGARVEVPSGTSSSAARAALLELLAHAEERGRLRTGLFASRVVRRHRELLEGTRVDGAQPLEPESLKRAVAHLTAEIALESLRTAWGARVEVRTVGSFAQEQASLALERDALQRLLELEETKRITESALSRIGGVPAPDFEDPAAVHRLIRGLSLAELHQKTSEVREKINEVLSSIGESGHHASAMLRRSIERRDPEACRVAFDDLRAARAVAADAIRRRELADRLSNVPRLLSTMPATEEIVWLDRGETFEAAWHWSYANAELEKILDPDEPRRLSLELRVLEDGENKTLSELAAELAWLRMFNSLSNEQSQALTAWTKAVRRIGKGTGKYAPEHRRVAREYMGKARDAIPAWIMPMYRVAESVTAEAEPFDVVIIDEASQSGVESLFLFYLAKQVIVVGDDKQIAPEAVGVNQAEVMRLQRQYLQGLPFAALYSPTVSLFDQAETRFPGATIRLTEHFRCMPEIIEFSNRIAYRHQPLVPLRQFGADRLDPIKTVHLPFGYREGGAQAINRAEAEEVVARIEKMCADTRYDDLTFGVISLQGEAQARLIETKLIERVGPQQMLERRIVCGDAYAFQGDERNVMFLSMVAAPNARIGPLSKDQDRRRFNVAASRAKDQVWLIHSVNPEDLSSTDVRRELLEYYLHPEIQHLEELAEFDDTIVNPPFESRFEQDVYLEIRRPGYRVAPQVRFAGYRIDLVIEGAANRLAVECDGDEWHGISRWEADSTRQRQLERAGWRFERIRGSSFYRDPEAALEPVWAACASLGIEPGRSSSPTLPSTREGPISRVDDADGGEGNFLDTRPDGFPPALTSDDSQPLPDTVLEEHPRNVPVIEPIEDSERAPTTAASSSNGEELRATSSLRHPGVEGDRHSETQAKRASPLLSPYQEWHGSGLPDPREVSRREIAEHLLEIVRAEGPVTTDRMYELFVKGAPGVSRVGRHARSGLNKGLFHLTGRVDIDEFPNPVTHWPQRVVRVTGSHPISVRELGPRSLYQVPLNEIAAILDAGKHGRPELDAEGLKRYALEVYGLNRLTERASQFLDAAMGLISDGA